MGSINVYDDGSQSWGGIATGMAGAITGAPAKAAAFTHTIETIKDQRIKREREQQLWDAANAAAANVNAATLPAAVAPREYTAADISTPAVLDAPLSVTDRTSGLRGGADVPNGMFTDPRELAKAEADRRLAVAGQKAAILADPKQWAQQTAYGNVASAGVPESAMERAKLDFLAGKGMPTHLGTDESKSPLKNFNELDPTTNQPTGRQVSATKAPGVNWVLGSPRGLTPDNPIESAPIAQNNFNQLAAKIQAKIAAGQPISDVELNAARATRDNGWQKEIKIEKDGETGKYLPIVTYKIPPPTAGPSAALMQLLDSIDGRPAGAGATPAAPGAPGAPGAAAAPAGSPLVQLQPTIGTGDVNPVVQRYMHNPVVVSIENAKNGYSSFLGNVNNNDPAADLSLVIGAAKILDPPSVVREGEVENVRKTGGVMDKYIGMINQAATGESGLTREVRAQLWNMVNEKLKLDVANAKAIREQHLVQLSDRNVTDPNKYLPPLPEVIPVDWNKISNYTVRDQRPDTAPVPVTAPSAPSSRRSADDILNGR
jgi:hypothetical protein